MVWVIALYQDSANRLDMVLSKWVRAASACCQLDETKLLSRFYRVYLVCRSPPRLRLKRASIILHKHCSPFSPWSGTIVVRIKTESTQVMGSYYNTRKGDTLTGVSILLLLLVSVVVLLRMYVRARIVRSFGPDDWAIIFATVSLLPSP